MRSVFLLILIMIPLLSGAGLCLVRGGKQGILSILTITATCITSVFAWCILLIGVQGPIELIRFPPVLILLLRLDGIGRFFLGLIAAL